MGRTKRAADGGLVSHGLNRADARMTIFEDDEDYAAVEQVLEEAVERTQMRLLAHCVFPTRMTAFFACLLLAISAAE